MGEVLYSTTDTPQAAYLIQAGFPLLEIQFETRLNGKRQATFVFNSTSQLKASVNLYEQGKAVINLAIYEHIKAGLLDKIMRGLP